MSAFPDIFFAIIGVLLPLAVVPLAIIWIVTRRWGGPGK